MAEGLRQSAIKAIDKHADELNILSQEIWKKPELAFEEHFAHDLLTSFLEQKGFEVTRKYVLDTAFKATYGPSNSKGPHIAVLCEYDALPDIGHACGHNLIAEVGIAAALGIKAALESSENDIGMLTVLGTPAEEGGGGKLALLKNGVFDDIHIAVMAHPAPRNYTRKPILGRRKLNVKYYGKASHAAGYPWDGVNALDAAVMCYNNISCLRQQCKPSWRVHGVITHGGLKSNIIPDFSSLEYGIRAYTNTEMNILEEKVKRCIRAAADATGCKVEIEEPDDAYTGMWFNNTLCDLYEKHCSMLGVEINNDVDESPLGSTDMGNVSNVVPSIHPCFHMGTSAANHTRDFTTAGGLPEAQPFTLNQGKAIALTAIDVFTDSNLLSQIQQDFILDSQKD